MTYRGKVDQNEKPELVSGTSAVFYHPEPGDVVITPAKAAERGWLEEKETVFSLTGQDGAKTLMPLLRRIGSLYQRGAKSAIDNLDLTDLILPKGGRLRISLSDVPPDSVKDLSELFEVIAGLVKTGENTEAYLDITNPQDDCPFMKVLRKDSTGQKDKDDCKIQ